MDSKSFVQWGILQLSFSKGFYKHVGFYKYLKSFVQWRICKDQILRAIIKSYTALRADFLCGWLVGYGYHYQVLEDDSHGRMLPDKRNKASY